MKIPVVIFTFSCDAIAASVAANRAASCGLGPVFIEEDSHQPLPPTIRRDMERQGHFVRRTNFPRIRNIRGLETYKGLMASYRHVFKQTGATHLVKLDSDTLIIRPERIRKAAEDDVCAASLVTVEYSFYGCCCVISDRLVAGIQETLNQWNGIPGHDSRNLAEDTATGDMARKLDLGEVREWPFSYDAGGFAAGWKYGEAKVPFSEYIRRFDVVTFGNRQLLTGPDCDRRDQVGLAMMRHVREIPASLLQFTKA